MLNEGVGEMTKTELKQLVKDLFKQEFGREKKSIVTKDDVKDIIRQMIKKHYKDMWLKSNVVIDNL